MSEDRANVLMLPGTNRARYEQMPDESTQAFHAFTHYRDLGSERDRDAAWAQHLADCEPHKKRTKTAPGHWTKWSADHAWLERAIAYDHDIDATKLASAREEAVEAGKRQAHIAGEALEVLAAPALAFARKFTEEPNTWETIASQLTPLQMADFTKDLASAMATLAKMQREAIGVGNVAEGAGQEGAVTVKVVFEVDPEFRL